MIEYNSKMDKSMKMRRNTTTPGVPEVKVDLVEKSAVDISLNGPPLLTSQSYEPAAYMRMNSVPESPKSSQSMSRPRILDTSGNNTQSDFQRQKGPGRPTSSVLAQAGQQ